MIRILLHYIKNELGWYPFLFAAIMCSRVLGFLQAPMAALSYVALVLAAYYSLKKAFTVDSLCRLLLVYLPVNILFALPDPIFHSWARYITFLILFIAVSPLVTSREAKEFRYRTFKSTMIVCIAIAVISFACYFLGINFMKNSYTGMVQEYLGDAQAGTFGGITRQSMLLGPVSGVAFIACTYMALFKQKTWFWALAVCCLGSAFFAASRSAILATVAGGLAMCFFNARERAKLMKRMAPVILVAVLTIPYWSFALNGINKKNKGSIESGINVDSRSKKWNCRIEEWKSSPVWGIGFVAVSDRDYYDKNGNIEPGSSWLAILSMTGIIGFLLVGGIFVKGLRNATRERSSEGAMIAGVLVMLIVHMIAEGYIFSAGGFLCFLVWLTLACAMDYEPSLADE